MPTSSHPWRTGIALAFVSALASCTIIRYARLYPTNDAARPGGVLTAKFEAHGTGHGAITLLMPDGEDLQGQFSIVRGSAGGLYLLQY
jgi:hypothetical protein